MKLNNSAEDDAGPTTLNSACGFSQDLVDNPCSSSIISGKIPKKILENDIIEIKLVVATEKLPLFAALIYFSR